MPDVADYLDEDELLPESTEEQLLRMYGPNAPASGQPLQSAPADYGDDEHEFGPPTAPPPPAASVDPGFTKSIDWLKTLQGERPVLTQPKWWQRGLGAIAGGFAGYSNAAGRTKNPIDIGAMAGNILHPGYQSKLQEWQSKLAPAEALAKLEGEKQAAWWKGRAANTEEAYKQAETNRANQQGSMYANRANQERNRYSVDSKTGAIFDRVTGETKTPAPTMAERKKMAMEATGNEDMANYYAINGSLSGYGSTMATPKPEHKPTSPTEVLMDPNATPEQKAIAKYLFAQEHRPPAATNLNFNGIPGAPGQPNEVDPMIKAVGDYETMPPMPRSSSPASVATYKQIVAAVKKYNPNWDAKNYTVVQGALKDFGSGKTSQTADALNTVSGHLLTLDQAASALKNNDVNALNRIGNAFGLQLGTAGGSAVAKYNTIVHRIGPELGRAYNTATEGENNINQSDFDAARGPDLIHGAISTSAQLLNGKIDSLRHRWETQVKKYNPNREFEAVSSAALNAFQKLGGQSGGGMVAVQIPGHPPGQIPSANLAAFKAAHPDAKVQ